MTDEAGEFESNLEVTAAVLVGLAFGLIFVAIISFIDPHPMTTFAIGVALMIGGFSVLSVDLHRRGELVEPKQGQHTDDWERENL